jgi:hypothetical protein
MAKTVDVAPPDKKDQKKLTRTAFSIHPIIHCLFYTVLNTKSY